MPEVRSKVTTSQQAVQILKINLNSNQISHQRLRNMSILVTLLNEFRDPPCMAK